MSEYRRNNFLKNLRGENLHYDWLLLTIVVIICASGLAFLASCLSTRGQAVFMREFLKQFLFGTWIGGVAAFILARIDYHVLLKYSKLMMATVFGLLGFLASFAIYADIFNLSKKAVVSAVRWLPIRPYEANGAIRWIDFPLLPNFQPVELAKLAILVYFSAFLYNNQKEQITWAKFKRPLYLFFAMSVLILVQPDLGSVLLIFGILLAAMWVGKVPEKFLIPITILVLIAGFAMIFFTGYRRTRLEAFLTNDSAKAYQVTQVRLAIQNGGFWGKGYGNSEFKQRNLIPEVTTDGIIGVIGEEMGFVFTTAFLSLYLLFLVRGLKIASEAPDVGGKALATGISVWIATQAFLNIAGITGMIPLKGLPLPFVSAGGSSMIINLMAVGILLNVSHQKVAQEGKSPVLGGVRYKRKPVR